MRDVTDSDVKYCFEDEEWEHVLRNTVDSQMHRLPIMDHDKRLGGIVVPVIWGPNRMRRLPVRRWAGFLSPVSTLTERVVSNTCTATPLAAPALAKSSTAATLCQL